MRAAWLLLVITIVGILEQIAPQKRMLIVDTIINQSMEWIWVEWICANIIVEPGVRPGICWVMMQDTQSNETSDRTVWNIPEVKKPGAIADQNIEEWIFESLVNLTHFDI